MQICKLEINNFRGIKKASLLLPKHCVLIGDNNIGKTTVLEAIDLTLGPDRINSAYPIDEHDFYQGKYSSVSSDTTIAEGENQEIQIAENVPIDPPKINIEATVIGLSEEQLARFGDFIEWWDLSTNSLYVEPRPEGLDAENIQPALRVIFIGEYDPDDDDFVGNTYYSRSILENEEPIKFTKRDKQFCGFLYLRSIRTGSRALSLERGSLLDIILRLKEVRPQMWEETINNLASFQVASDPEHGISGVLDSINQALKKYVPKEWGIEPHLRVSDLTRDHLRKVITAFIATGDGDHAAPFYRQGTGTINMLVLAMLSLIAEDKQNVIFAMEEPETAIPPYAQKRIIHEICGLSTQAIFTSHSPYVLEEFTLENTLVLNRDKDGVLTQSSIELPSSVKLKRYRQEFRTRFSEGLLARRVLIAEGATESSAFPAVCRRLAELNPAEFSSLESLGICTLDAGGETNIPDMAKLYRGLGKTTFAICDLQSNQHKQLIENEVSLLLMHNDTGFENMVLNNTDNAAMLRFFQFINVPQHLLQKYQNPQGQIYELLSDYFQSKKADWGIADFLSQCNEHEIPEWLRNSAKAIKQACEQVMKNTDAPNPPEQ